MLLRALQQEQAWRCEQERLRCSSLPVSCPSLPVDDAKARWFWAIWRQILSGEIRGGRKAPAAGGTYSQDPGKPGDQFAPVLYLLTAWKVTGLEFMQVFKQTMTCLCVFLQFLQLQHNACTTLSYHAISWCYCHQRTPHLCFHTMLLTSAQCSQAHSG